MIADAHSGDGSALLKKRFDVCIAGAGVAGIVLGLELARKGFEVALLEGGGRSFSAESQDLYKGRNVGREYFDLDHTRLRYLGGCSNHWGGWCRPLEASDFLGRSHPPTPSWPITKSELDPWAGQAAAILELPRLPVAQRSFQMDDGRLDETDFVFSPPVRFGERYAAQLEKSTNLTLILNASLVDIRLSDDARHTRAFVFATRDRPDRRSVVNADSFVLALGGLENPRALLNCNKLVPAGIGNEHDLVGRYFSDHPHFNVGVYLSFDTARFGGARAQYLAASEAFIREKRISPCQLRLQMGSTRWDSPATKWTEQEYRLLCKSMKLFDSAASLLSGAVDKEKCSWGLLRAVWEQIPNPQSRVRLGAEKDPFGWQRIELDWQLSDADWKTPRETTMEFAKMMIRRQLGRIRVLPWILEGGEPPAGEEMGGNHHMGTTRMAAAATDGVVDRNCRIFGVSNLYVAGSSVFPSYGYTNPTFTIVQLALRLSRHLQTQHL